jgi:hypothetical protein
MNELTAIAMTFGVSEPVFTIRPSGRELEFTVKNQYQIPPSEDPVYNAVKHHCSERLNVGSRCFFSNVDVRYVWNGMVKTIRETFSNTSPLKNPKQSKLYKWLQDTDALYNNASCQVGFISLYRYVINNGVDGSRDHENQHAKNLIAILELMKEKHEN